MSSDCVGVVLAGGRSLRFGAPKRSALLGGRTLTERAVEALSTVVPDVVVSVGRDDAFDLPAASTVVDAIADGGPLFGVMAGLEYAAGENRGGALVLAVDLPLVGAPELRRLIPAPGEPATIVAAAGPEGEPLQPLCGWYPVTLLPRLAAFLDGGGRKVLDFVDGHSRRWVRFADARVLTNVNAPSDLSALYRSEA